MQAERSINDLQLLAEKAVQFARNGGCRRICGNTCMHICAFLQTCRLPDADFGACIGLAVDAFIKAAVAEMN